MKVIVILMLCLGTGEIVAHPGIGIVMDSQGNVYYTDLENVWKIDGLGKKTVVVNNVHTHELYIDEQDNLYGEHLWYNGEAVNTWGYYIWKLSSRGDLSKIIPPTEGFRTTYSFVRDLQGNMYYVDGEKGSQKILQKDTRGKVTSRSLSCLTNVRWMTASSEGNIYAIDFHDLKKIDQQGHVTVLAADLPDKKLSQLFVNEPHYLSGVSVDKNENTYVADYSGRQVKKVTSRGEVSTLATTNIPWSPTGTLLAPNGDFWILECSITNSVRVECITKSGKRIVY